MVYCWKWKILKIIKVIIGYVIIVDVCFKIIKIIIFIKIFNVFVFKRVISIFLLIYV